MRAFQKTWCFAFLAAFLLTPPLLTHGRDVRQEIARESERYRAAHFSGGRLPPKHDWRARGTKHVNGTTIPAVPGGVGYGYYYYDDALLWTNSTVADYYVITPTFLGQGVSYLYLTATCRARLGVEAFVEYGESINPAQFWIYDWSQSESNRWQVTVDLPIAHPEYVTSRPDEFAVTRQMIHLRNGTFYQGFSGGQHQWRNSVWLFDFQRGGWDLVYSHEYGTTSLSDNLYQTGATTGNWGPIVETFDSNYVHVYPIGFDLIRLFQDGRNEPLWLDASNSYAQASSPWQLLSRTINTSFVVSVNAGDNPGGSNGVGTLCVTANAAVAGFSQSQSVGTNASGWVITPWSNSWDKIIVGLPAGEYSVVFKPVAGLTTPAPQQFTIVSNHISTVVVDYMFPRLYFQGVAFTDNALILQWNSVTGLVYQLQFKTNLDQTVWFNLGDPLNGTGGSLSVTDSIGLNPRRFYRIKQQ